jgi:hypothetical protein
MGRAVSGSSTPDAHATFLGEHPFPLVYKASDAFGIFNFAKQKMALGVSVGLAATWEEFRPPWWLYCLGNL